MAGGVDALLPAPTREWAPVLQSLPQQSPCCLENFSEKVSSDRSAGSTASKARPSGLIRRDLVLHFPLYLSNLGLRPSSVCAVITSPGKTVPLPNCLHSQEIVPNSQLNLISPSLLNPPRQTCAALLPLITVLYVKRLYGIICSCFFRSDMQNYFHESQPSSLTHFPWACLDFFLQSCRPCPKLKCVRLPSALKSGTRLP